MDEKTKLSLLFFGGGVLFGSLGLYLVARSASPAIKRKISSEITTRIQERIVGILGLSTVTSINDPVTIGLIKNNISDPIASGIVGGLYLE